MRWRDGVDYRISINPTESTSNYEAYSRSTQSAQPALLPLIHQSTEGESVANITLLLLYKEIEAKDAPSRLKIWNILESE